jgi:hypothetical protein
MSELRTLLEREIERTPIEPFGLDELRQRRDRIRARERAMVIGFAVAILVAGVAAFLGAIRSEPKPAEPPLPSPGALERVTTVGGVEVTTPREWYLVDQWRSTDTEVYPASERPLVLFEASNLDPGLGDPICPARIGDATPLPPDGVVVSVTLGEAKDVAERCTGTIDRVRTGTHDTPFGALPFTSVVIAGPDATDADRATARTVLESIEANGTFELVRHRDDPAYILDGWLEGSDASLIEARPTDDGKIELSVLGDESIAVSTIVVSGSEPFEGETLGAVTDEVDHVELHRSGTDEPQTAVRLVLPPSLAAEFDAFVFQPQPTGGPFEVVAIGGDGEILASSLPPLTETERVGTVRAFGNEWAVKLSTAADGYWGATCIEPAATSTLDPCERGFGGGSLVQTFEDPAPAVFVSQLAGVDAIDVVTDDGRTFPMVRIPIGGGGAVFVAALEGAGDGRFVYHFDGQVDDGRRPEARVEWSDVGQEIGVLEAVE